MPAYKHPALEFLSRLPQYSGSLLFGAVVHLRFGTVVRHYDSAESAHADLLSLTWPGQNPAINLTVDAMKYVQLAANEALTLGFDAQIIDADLQSYLRDVHRQT